MHRGLRSLLALLATAASLVCALRTLAPDRDTAHYVGMARAFFAGDWRAALAETFPPLHPLLLALAGPFCELPEHWWLAAQLEGALLNGIGLWLLLGIVKERQGRVAALVCGAWLAFALLPAWQAADGMSEPLFRVMLLLWMRGLSGGWHPLFAGLAFLTRAEGAVLLPLSLAALWKRGWQARARACLAAAAPAALYLGLRGAAGQPFALLPKAAVMRPLAAWSEPDLASALGHWLREAGELALQGFDGLGYLAWPCLLVALARRRSSGGWHATLGTLPLAAALCALAVVPCYFANRRFWTPWLPVLLPIAALPIAELARRRPRIAAALVLAALLPHAVRLPRARRARLAPLRALALELRAALPAHAGVASDLPRLLFFAGRPPQPPRSIAGSELMALAARPDTRAVVSRPERGKLDAARLTALGYARRARTDLELWTR